MIASTGIYTQIACIVAMTMESRLRCSLQTIMLRKTGSSFNADLLMTEVFVGQHARLVDTPFAPLRLTKRATPIGKRGGSSQWTDTCRPSGGGRWKEASLLAKVSVGRPLLMHLKRPTVSH